MIPIASAELDPVKIITTPTSISTIATTGKAQFALYRVIRAPLSLWTLRDDAGAAPPGVYGSGLRKSTAPWLLHTTPIVTIKGRCAQSNAMAGGTAVRRPAALQRLAARIGLKIPRSKSGTERLVTRNDAAVHASSRLLRWRSWLYLDRQPILAA